MFLQQDELTRKMMQRVDHVVLEEQRMEGDVYRGNPIEEEIFADRNTTMEAKQEWMTEKLQDQEFAFTRLRYQLPIPETPIEGFRECPPAQLPQVNNKKKRKAFYNAQKKKAKTHEGGLLSDEELTAMNHLQTSKWGQNSWMKEKTGGVTQGEIYNQVLTGEYSNFEKLDVTLRNTLATRYMKEAFAMPVVGQTPVEYVKMLKEKAGIQGLMNPLFRLGLSLAMKSGFKDVPPEFFRQVDNGCGTEIMLETLSHRIKEEDVPDGELANLQESKRKMQAGQKFMATNLLLMHLGRMTKQTTANGATNREDWDGDVATAFTHCSRVAVITPALTTKRAKPEYDHMWAMLRGTHDGEVGVPFRGENSYGLFRRGASTHDFAQRKVAGSPFKEKKVTAKFLGQQGLNVSIGGLYNKGVGGNPILQDGSCGHIYSMRREETLDACGGFLIGFESDAHKKTNQLGHTHGFGNGEYASSFGSQRVDEIGNKYGGREVDVSEMNVGAINEYLDALHTYLDRAHRDGRDTTPLMEKLVGKHMNAQGLSDFAAYLEQNTPTN